MTPPALPTNELMRLAALNQCKILDTAPEGPFDDIARLAASCCQTPIALVSLIDANRQWFKSKVGLDVSETSRQISFCGHAILTTDAFLVSDALTDVRFADNPLVTSAPFIRSYAGIPLVTSKGYALGTLCVIDYVPRQFSEEQIENLKLLAHQVVRQLELRQNLLELERTLLTQQVPQQLPKSFLGKLAIGLGLFLVVLIGLLSSSYDDVWTTRAAYIICTLSSFSIFCWLFYLIYREGSIHQQTKVTLEQERNFVSAILDTVGALVIVLDADGKIVRFNRACEQTTGFSFAQVWREYFWNLFIVPEEISSVKRVFKDLQSGNCPNSYRNYWLTKTGERRLIDWSNTVLTNSEGMVEYVIGTGIDVTDRQKAEQTIAKLATIVESSDDAIVSTDLNGTVISWNSGAEKIYGYTAAEANGKQLVDLVMIQTVEPGESSLTSSSQIVLPKKPDKTEHYTKDRQKIDVFLTASELKDPDGQVIGNSMIARDISELRAIERIKEEFLSVMGHELRTPLASLRGSLGLLLTGNLGSLTEKGKRMLKIAMSNTDRLIHVINDILDLDHLTSRDRPLLEESCSLTEITNQIQATMQPMLEKAGVGLAVSLVPAQLQVDPKDLTRILTNLLDNAIKFSTSGQSIWLSTELQTPEQIDPNASTQDPIATQVLIQIKDQGRGIPDHQLDQIFEPFYQVDASDSRQQGGVGLGLTICRKLVELYGGQIWVKSVLGAGSSFFVRLPIAQDSTTVSSTESADGATPEQQFSSEGN